MYYYFYKTTNKVNGKYYYGVHSSTSKSGEDSYLGSGTLLCRAVEKYGKENFSKEILKEFNSMEEAYVYEAEHVTLEQVKDPNCYNVQTGGLGGPMGTVYLHRGEEMIKVFPEQIPEFLEKGWERGKSEEFLKRTYRPTLSEEHKRKISEAHKGKPSPLRGQKLSEERRKQISEAKKGKPSGMLGKKQSEETKRKISEANRGHTVSVAIRQKLSEERKGTICMWKEGEKNIHVKVEEVEQYEALGWQKGSWYKHSEETLQKISKSHRGARFVIVNRENQIKHILPENLQEYLNQGWVRGTGKSYADREALSKARKGKVCLLSREGRRTYVTSEEEQEYLSKGYYKTKKEWLQHNQ